MKFGILKQTLLQGTEACISFSILQGQKLVEDYG
jgi:hypothetical protein